VTPLLPTSALPPTHSYSVSPARDGSSAPDADDNPADRRQTPNQALGADGGHAPTPSGRRGPRVTPTLAPRRWRGRRWATYPILPPPGHRIVIHSLGGIPPPHRHLSGRDDEDAAAVLPSLGGRRNEYFRVLSSVGRPLVATRGVRLALRLARPPLVGCEPVVRASVHGPVAGHGPYAVSELVGVGGVLGPRGGYPATAASYVSRGNITRTRIKDNKFQGEEF